MTSSSLSFQVPGGLPVALLVFIALAVLASLSSRRLKVQGSRRWVLIGLRWLTAVLLALLVAQPTLRVQRTQMLAGRVAVLFDDSASLAFGKPGERRIDTARELLQRWRAEALELPGRVRFFRVTGGLQKLDATLDASAALTGAGSQSRLGTALEEAAELPFQPTSIVLVSDGADSSHEPLPREAGIPVHTVGFVDDPELRDDSVVSVEPDARVYLHTQARVLVQVQSVGLGPRELQLRLERDGVLVDSQSVRLEDGDSSHVQLSFMPRELGRQSYVVRLDAADDDMIAANDSLPFVVDVVRERLRVLHVAGAPSWDQRFLRGFLKRDPSLDLISFFILRSTHDMTMSDSSELALIPFPTDELFREHLSSFDVVVLQNFNYAPYRMARYLPLIRDYVRNGGAIAMLGGPLSFEAGGYSDTPIAEVLPVRMLPASSAAKVVSGRFAPRRSKLHQHHPLLDLHPDPAAAARAWAGLEPLEGAHQFAGLAEGGVALWTHPSARAGGAPLPVLAVGQFGKGRAMALGTDTVWHWTVPTAGRGGDPTVYDRFWDRALRWLSRDPSLAPTQLSTDFERYGPGDTVRLKALVRGADYTPRSEATATVRRLDAADDAEPLRVLPLKADANSEADITFRAPEASGLYVVEVQGEGVDSQSEPFLVTEGGAELADPRMRSVPMRALAEMNGGKAFESPDAAPALQTLLTPTEVSAGVQRHAPLSGLWAGLVALCVFCLEWWLRRAWGER